ncbi:MAG: TAXI family TRAP transporter solute-binding subunit [Ignavibacteriales bacterium]
MKRRPGINSLVRLSYLVVVCAIAVAALSGCGGKVTPAPTGESKPESKPAPNVSISIGTANATGTYYPIGAAMAKTLQDHDKAIQAVAQTTGGSIENIKLVSSGEVNIGIANQMHFALAAKGVSPFTKPIDNLRSLFPLAGENYVMKHAWQAAVPKDSPIKSIADFRGRRIGVGPAGSGTEVYTKQILESAGITYNDIDERFLSYEEQATAMADGTLDVATFYSAVPTGGVEELAATKPIRLVSIEEDVINKSISDWGFMKRTVPANSYKWQTEPVQTVVANYHVIFVNKDMDIDLAYRLTKTVMDNIKEIWSSNPGADKVDAKGVEMGLTAPPLHPGALKYFKEIGMKVPDSVIPPEAK